MNARPDMTQALAQTAQTDRTDLDHVRALGGISLALAMQDEAGWEAARMILAQSLTRYERGSLAVICGEGAGFPYLASDDPDVDARQWAEMASEDELWSLARWAFKAMDPEMQGKFLRAAGKAVAA